MVRTKETPPILFLVFNRPDTTAAVFAEIRKAKPKKLYIAADGPRKDRAEEAELCAKVREIATHVDWKCTVKTLFRKENLGCGKAVSSGISWFFKHEEMGIILEDDCLPDQSFFPFCGELLTKYKNDTRVMDICAFNPLSKNKYSDSDYFFSTFGSVWGWASWRRAWKSYDFEMHAYPEFKESHTIKDFGFSASVQKRYLALFDLVRNKKIDTWDYQWVFAKLHDHGASIVPSKNLIKNIGFGSTSTNNVGAGQKFRSISLAMVSFPLKYPQKYLITTKFTEDFFRFIYPSFFRIGLKHINAQWKRFFQREM